MDVSIVKERHSSELARGSRLPWLVGIVVLLGAALSAVIGVLGLLAPGPLLAVLGYSGEPVTSATRQLAAYVGARELPIAAALIGFLFIRSYKLLATVMLLFATSNALDSLDALAFQRWAQLPGAAAVAVVFGLVAVWLLRRESRSQAGRRRETSV